LVYYFELHWGDEIQIMLVVSNPSIERLLAGSALEVVIIAEEGWIPSEIFANIGASHLPVQANVYERESM
jgi:hypothetical protein